MMPTLALPTDVSAGAVGPDQARARLLDDGHDLEHVEGRDMFGDADDGLDARADGLEDRVGRAGGGNVDHAGVGARF